MGNPFVYRNFLKSWCLDNYYYYDIYEVVAGGLSWLEANPKTKGVTRTANTEKSLRILLENDVANMNVFFRRVK